MDDWVRQGDPGGVFSRLASTTSDSDGTCTDNIIAGKSHYSLDLTHSRSVSLKRTKCNRRISLVRTSWLATQRPVGHETARKLCFGSLQSYATALPVKPEIIASSCR